MGAGSLERAECTRSSSFCILPIKPRIWYREPDLGSPAAELLPMLGRDGCCCPGTALGARMMDGVRRGPVGGPPAGMPDTLGPRAWRGRATKVPALGVAAGSREAMEAFRAGMGTMNGMGRMVRGASDSGGEGGVLSRGKAPVCR